jgi:hypothetical protein
MGNLLKGIVVFILFLFVTVYLSAQALDTAWTKTFGGSDGEGGVGNSVQQTTDGGYIVVGVTLSVSAGSLVVYLIKTDSLGDTLWTKTFGEGEGDCDNGLVVRQTTDGGYIVVATSDLVGGVYLIKTDSLGDTLWMKTFEEVNGGEGRSVQQTTDGGYIVAGWIYSYGTGSEDVYLIKTDSVGDSLWTKTFGGSGGERSYSVQQTTDGGYIIVGYTDPFRDVHYDVYLIKTDSLGDTLWTKTYGGTANEEGKSVQQTTDGGYIIIGYTTSYGAGYGDVYLIKTDSLGDTLWTKTYGGAGWESSESVQQTTDGGYIVVGGTDSYGAGWSDVYLIKTDPLGDIICTGTYGGTGPDGGVSVQQTTDEGYIVTGGISPYVTGNGYVYLIKIKPIQGITITSPNGGEKWLADSTYDITWTSYQTSGAVKIEYSLNNGIDWTEIIASTPDDGSHHWTTPYTTSDSCLVRVSDTNGLLEDVSNSVFRISPPFITVTSPNGGEEWYNEDNHNITWVSVGTSGEVKIGYSINNGKDWAEIIGCTTDDGSYLWNPPDTVSDSCLVSISDTNGSIADTSDAVFSIIPGSAGVPIGSLEVYSLNVRAVATGSQLDFTYNLPEKANDIKFTLYNIAGLKIKEENLKDNPAGFYSGRINLNGVSKGIYFIRMESNGGKFTQTKKFVLM